MTEDLATDLDSCVALIRTAPITDATRAYLTNQAAIYALFLSDHQAGRLAPDMEQENVVPSMLELIREFCAQVSDLILSNQAA